MTIQPAPAVIPQEHGRRQLQVEVREAHPEEADALAELVETVVRASDSYPRAAQDALLKGEGPHSFALRALHSPETLLVAVVPEVSHPVGFVLTRLYGDGVLMIEGIGVAPGYRRLGVGTALLHALLRRADQEGAYKVVAGAPTLDTDSRLFYASGGLEVTDQIPDETLGIDYFGFAGSIPDLLRAIPALRPASRPVAYTPGPHYPVDAAHFRGGEAFDLRTAPNHSDGLLLATVHQQLDTSANARLYGSAALAERVVDAIYRITWCPDGASHPPLHRGERAEVLRLCRLLFAALDHGDRGELALVQLACPHCGFLPPVCSVDDRTPHTCRVRTGTAERSGALPADPLHDRAS